MIQASEARLYTFSQETKDKLRKFRLGTYAIHTFDTPKDTFLICLPAPEQKTRKQ